MDRGRDSAGFDAYERTVEFQMIMGIAEALREEFGVGIDAHPGGGDIEAGVVNRAFVAAARCILMAVIGSEDDLPGVLTRALRLAARRWLAEHGVDERLAERLIDQELGLG